MSRRALGLFALGLLITVFVAVVLSQFASSEPDGLEYVAEDQGFADTAEDHDLADAPLAGHSDIAPGRKTDPGPGFDWARLRKEIAVA